MTTKHVLAALACVGATAGTAHAFCGFYVSGSGAKLGNDATQVVLVRDGTRTVLSMQNDYNGPLDDFAMVVPVPVVLHEQDVKTLPKSVFEHVESLGAPRLVEYWEEDPCAFDKARGAGGMVGAVFGAAPDYDGAAPTTTAVKIEAKFDVAEYKILVLSAKDSTGLAEWLRQNHYNIPDGAEPLLRPYVEGGSKFFVAKVDPSKVALVAGHAALSPLRFHYDSDEFALPVRLGMANSNGTQDLIVNIFSRKDRYEVANYPNVFAPTNLDVRGSVKARFGEFYAALFDRTIQTHPGAVVTEYAWTATRGYHCDPCPDLDVTPEDVMTLGGDVVGGGLDNDFVLTRLHARYGKGALADDLRFRVAKPIVGGREERDEKTGELEPGVHPSDDGQSHFQARYAIRHWWTGPIACTNPRRGIWGGPPDGGQQVIAAQKLAFAPRGKLSLAGSVLADVPDLKVWLPRQGAPAPPPSKFAQPPGGGASGGVKAMSFGAGALGALGMIGLGALILRRRRA